MGIKFTCPHCKSALNVKSNLAGKRGRCPKCDEKIDIPSEGDVADTAATVAAGNASISRPAATTSSLTAATFDTARPGAAARVPGHQASVPLLHEEADPAVVPVKAAGQQAGHPNVIDESPNMQWYVMPPGASSQYGPAAGEAMRSWIKEGRVTADSLVWRQDWPEWKRAGTVFPELDVLGGAVGQMAAMATGHAIPTAMGALPTAAGVLPAAAGVLPAAAGVLPMAGMAPGFGVPAGGAPGALPVAAGGFPVVPPKNAAGALRRTPYRPRSNTGPVTAIIVLVILMIPLSYFVIKVVSDQWSQPSVAPAAGTENQDK